MCSLHPIPTATAWDQTASAMACVVRWSPGSLFTGVIAQCTCELQTTAKNLQGIAYLGLTGLLAAGKAITDTNKSYVVKRWKAYCEGSSITNELSDIGMDTSVRIVMSVQSRLHQTNVGRMWARRVISHNTYPQGLRDQLLMVYDYVGMKASQMMAKYLTTSPLVLVLPGVIDDAVRFKTAYDAVKTRQGEAEFLYTRLMGMGEELNHFRFPDLYYCAINYYKSIGALGGPDGKFVKSQLETKTEASLLDKYCRISSANSGISESQLHAWVENAARVGGVVQEEDLRVVRRKLKRKREEAEDLE